MKKGEEASRVNHYCNKAFGHESLAMGSTGPRKIRNSDVGELSTNRVWGTEKVAGRN